MTEVKSRPSSQRFLTASLSASNIRFSFEEAQMSVEEQGDLFFMREAIEESRLAYGEGEVPVGAIVVFERSIIGRGHNRVIQTSDPTAHAEILALREAALAVGNYRLTGATLYSTIEPCAMCAGAIVHARIHRLVYGASDPRAGAVETHFQICTTDFLNHRVTVEKGFLEADCRRMLQSFFRERRQQSNAERCESG